MAVVDKYFTINNSQIVDNYSCTLNQVDIIRNSNKFYIIQLLTDSTNYYLFTRYGRVGDKGVYSHKLYTNKTQAISEYLKTFKSKTGNIWATPFVKKAGKYMLLELETPKMVVINDNSKSNLDLQLDTKVLQFIKLIANKQLMTNTLINLDLDTTRMPLGKISKNQISNAHILLKYLSDNFTTLSQQDFLQYSSEFWTIVPYATRRNITPPIINDLDNIKKCSSLLEALENLEIAGTILQQSRSELDIYNSLGITLTPLSDPNELAILNNYIINTHGKTHKYQLELIQAFKIDKSLQDQQDTANLFSSISNHYLLFHGSRMSNFMGIISEGLRIPKASQVSNGSTLGRGCYFADSITKSYNYTYSNETNNTGFVLICEVALGNPHIVYGCHDVDSVDSGYHSRMAKGKSTPNHLQFTTLNNVIVPSGSLIPNSEASHSTFLYNEYVIYNIHQYRFRYLVQLRNY